MCLTYCAQFLLKPIQHIILIGILTFVPGPPLEHFNNNTHLNSEILKRLGQQVHSQLIIVNVSVFT